MILPMFPKSRFSSFPSSLQLFAVYPPCALHPRHSKFRQPFAPSFTPRVMEPDISKLIKSLSEGVSRKHVVEVCSSLVFMALRILKRSSGNVQSVVPFTAITPDCLR